MRILAGIVEGSKASGRLIPDSECSVLEMRLQLTVIKAVRTKLAELEGFHLSTRWSRLNATRSSVGFKYVVIKLLILASM